jgi:predicted ATPase
MIRSIHVQNFRCYSDLKLDGVARLNLVVGDNGSGKTSLLEAIFLTLASGASVALRMRQARGLEGVFGGTTFQIEEALWGDFFHNYDMSKPILVEIEGDGPENRTMSIGRGQAAAFFAIDDEGRIGAEAQTSPVNFQWKDAKGGLHLVTPVVDKTGLQLPETGENLPDFFMIGTGQTVTATENANRFSDLSKRNQHGRFIETFIKEFNWLEDLNLELHATAPVVFGTLKGSRRKIPVPNMSGGMNRIMAILLCIAASPRSIVIVDEIETGIFYSHLPSFWRSLRDFADEYESQIIASTHSKECIDALLSLGVTEELSIWRTERGEEGHTVTQLTGQDAYLIHELDEEIR